MNHAGDNENDMMFSHRKVHLHATNVEEEIGCLLRIV